MSVRIEIDKASARHLEQQFNKLKPGVERSLYSAIVKLGMKIKTSAQLRLTGQGHIVTSRLKNSIYLQAKKPIELPPNTGGTGNSKKYVDKDGQVFDSEMRSVGLSDNEFAVGTNVEYGGKIERMDSYLYWAMKNVDVTQNVGKDMQDDAKFGRFLNSQKIKP